MANTILQVDDLKTYFFLRRGVLKAVDGVSFKVEEGQTVGLVGESGSGKTITAMSLLRLEPKPAAKIVGGRILFEGRDLVQTDERTLRQLRGGRISLIMQDPMTSLNPVFTVGDQIGEVLRVHLDMKDNKAVSNGAIKALERVNIPSPASRIKDYPHQMSGGMRQRVVGSIAISCSPSLLIADEPTTSLDVTTQAQYLRLLTDMQERTGLGMLFITHDLGIVAKICDVVCVMYLGKVVETGSVREIWKTPRHPYTVGLLKSLPQAKGKIDRLYAMKGMVPSLLNLPAGCTFHPRCELANERCRQEYPPVFDRGSGHLVSCWQEENPA
ncbi:MAG: ABC transporter ATP-binding protein [Thermoleophilia bacterium]